MPMFADEILVPKMSGPGAPKNTCAGCHNGLKQGPYYDDDEKKGRHTVLDCLTELQTRVDNHRHHEYEIER